jgi:hypothetical protein
MFPWPAQTGASAQASCQPFPATGKAVCGKFLQYWQKNGGLAQQGYPISGEFNEVSDVDGKTYTVQYFERAVFELHPEKQPPYDVLLSLLGVQFYKQKYPDGASRQTPNTSSGSMTFKETGHRLGGIFLQYWQKNGGLAQQGYPISDEFMEKSDLDGKEYRVQYFERAVFEYHPENAAPNNVLLSQLGTFQLKRKYPAGEPTPGPKPTATTGGEPPRITLAEFKALYDKPATRPIILDVRPANSYRQGHIKGAISFPEADVDRRVGELPKDKLIVAYCQ